MGASADPGHTPHRGVPVGATPRDAVHRDAVPPTGVDADVARHAQALRSLDGALDDLLDVGVDGLPLDTCETSMRQLERATRRLRARQSALAGAIRRHRVASATSSASGSSDRHTAKRRAERSATDDVMDQRGCSPSDAKRMTDDARRLESHPRIRDAWEQGRITGRHVTHACNLLDLLTLDTRDAILDELIEAASSSNAVDFARYCRRRLIELRADRAERDERTRRSRRSVRATTGADGMLHLSGRLAGLEAELVMTALQAHRQPDDANTPPEHRRSSEQVTADALVQMCRNALVSPDAPTRQGAPIQVVVTIDHDAIMAGAGVVETEHLGPLPFDLVRQAMADAGVCRLLVDADQVPLEAGAQVRTVPSGLWRALRHRDGGCIADGCRAPASWCQVAHLDAPYRLGGRLSLQNAALMCLLHHTRYDHHGWRITWKGRRPQLHPPARPHRSTSSEPAGRSDRGDPRAGTLTRSEPTARPASADPSTRSGSADPPGRPRHDDPPVRSPSSGDDPPVRSRSSGDDPLVRSPSSDRGPGRDGEPPVAVHDGQLDLLAEPRAPYRRGEERGRRSARACRTRATSWPSR